MPLSLYMFMQIRHYHMSHTLGELKDTTCTLYMYMYINSYTQADISTHKLNVNMIITDKKPIMINAENIISVK